MTPRKLSPASRAAMAAGARRARRATWGDQRAPGAKITIDADVAERFAARVHPRDRRAIATRAIARAIEEAS